MESPTSQAAYLLALQGFPRVGAWTAVRVARAFPDPSGWLDASDTRLIEELGKRFAGPLIAADRGDWARHLEHAESTVERHRSAGIGVVAIDEPDYPPLMRLAASPAAVLYVRGSLAALRNPLAVAVIGTRNPTRAGVEVARRIAGMLVDSGTLVVSGLASGIDTAAHVGALDAGGSTAAVLGTAIDKIFPAGNKQLASRIESEAGVLLSEYPMGFVTTGRQFVERDRLQAGMSAVVIAVQTGVEGGTLHTVRFAAESHRTVLVPRPLASEADHEAYGGITNLLDTGRALAIDGADDYARIAAFVRAQTEWLLRSDSAPQPAYGEVQATAISDLDAHDAPEQQDLGLA